MKSQLFLHTVCACLFVFCFFVFLLPSFMHSFFFIPCWRRRKWRQHWRRQQQQIVHFNPSKSFHCPPPHAPISLKSPFLGLCFVFCFFSLLFSFFFFLDKTDIDIENRHARSFKTRVLFDFWGFDFLPLINNLTSAQENTAHGPNTIKQNIEVLFFFFFVNFFFFFFTVLF